MTREFRAALLAIFVAWGASAAAQMGGPGMGPPPPGGPPFLRYVFPPKLVMQHQQEIALTQAQVDGIKRTMNDTQQQLLDVQWRLDAESEALGKLLSGDHVDEPAVLAKLDQVTATEQQVKRINFALLVRIKNLLSAEQQAKLRTLMRSSPQGGPPPPPPE